MDLVARLLITLIVVAFAAMSARIVMRTIQRRNRLIAVEREYATLRQQRDDIQFHIDWALSSNDKNEVNRLLIERNNLDKRLEGVQQKYARIQEMGAFTPKKLL
ncbi:unnamed protein product (mitochondrion) [Plasmodiophora brassicae]|uniref:Uncharacterized protein n=1 Tax=Plasmodiophora brassicae TaxID=37360 RepID=A0A0G4J200_PLABS|nr:hypothetical protein PBRA_008560 [Plasmodiophora brassicae]SPQ99459.1 unnamed protein product [Plasmodiophora brassicae]